MAYTPQTWVDGEAGGTPLSADRLNYMEAGIQAVSEAATVGDATDTTKGILRLAGDLDGTADAPTVPGLATKLDTKNNTVALVNLLVDLLASVTINDDGTDSGSWPNRLEFLFHSGTDTHRTGYFNEYGELRVAPAKTTTVPLRVFTRETTAQPAHSANCFELMDDRGTRTVLMSIDSVGNVRAPNLPGRVTTASVAPSSPAVGDVWIDMSAG